MNIEKLQQFKMLCLIVGLETLADVKLFASREKKQSEPLLQALKRYAEELKQD